MRLLFLPNVPGINDWTSCDKLNNLLDKDVNIIFYLTPTELIYDSHNKTKSIVSILKNKIIDKSCILFVAPGCMIEELGNIGGFGHITESNISSKCAVPGNVYYDFIPAVIEYYKGEHIDVEDIVVILDNANIMNRLYDYNYVKTIYYSSSMIEQLENYIKENGIKYLKPSTSTNWQTYLPVIDKIYDLKKENRLSIDTGILYQNFFLNNRLSNKLSILFTDRDDTIFVDSKEQTYRNFECIKSFLEAGNLVVIITTANHESTIFHENEYFETLWQQLLEYKNQIIGFPPFRSGITLGGVKIPIGHAALNKRGIIKQVIDMFLENKYELDKIYCVGDSAVDMDMIIESVSKFDAIGYHIRENDDFLSKVTDLDFFTNQDWDYIRNHGIKTFSSFMEQYVLIDSENQNKLKY